jgi:glucan biosynthesis protein
MRDAMDRRTLIKTLIAGLGASALPLAPLLWAQESEAGSGNNEKPFSYAWLKGHARELAAQPYLSHEGELPQSLKQLSWDDYQAIRFRKDHALWAESETAFQVQLFHLGLYFQSPVIIHEVIDGKATTLRYNPDFFDYEGQQPLGDLPGNLGYAGFRLHYQTNFSLDLAAFLGASYFRAVGSEMQYGMSARGLAIDTGVNGEEEFPRFSAFWLEKPQPGSQVMRVWALLDSPSTTGAYAFVLDPGRNMVMDVDVALYPRTELKRAGIAPLTSMYQVGENNRRMDYDWPKGEWGVGSIDLVEIPTVDETFDNIVAFWHPEEPLKPGQEYLYAYRLHWGERAPVSPQELATVQATRTGLGGVIGQDREYFSWRFAVDFAGGVLDMLGDNAEVEAVISANRGEVEITSARPLSAINGYRGMFDLVPGDSEEPVNIRMYLRLGDEPLTETWVYQYTPPPVSERKLY